MAWDDELDSKRSLTPLERKLLYENAKGRCQNPACKKKIEFHEMQVGHKTAHSKGGRTTLRKSVCLCYGCNHLQGTYSWATFLKKQGVVDPKTQLKKSLQALSLNQLKTLALKHKVKVTGRTVEDFLDSHRVAPTKGQYVNKLAGIVTEKEISTVPKAPPKPAKKKRRRKSDDSQF